MTFLGRRRSFWWGRYPVFAVLDGLLWEVLVLGVILVFISWPVGLLTLIVIAPVVWSSRNAYIRHRAYKELGVAAGDITSEVREVDPESGWSYLGAAAWRSRGNRWETVDVVLNPDGRYFFETADGYLYGADVGNGYGPDELVTLHIRHRLSLKPAKVAQLTRDSPAVIRGQGGRALFGGGP